ncbi:MAG: folate-binding protein [Propionibacteriaceae bacterium]|nr:folate-binding protein [Propionibacteriaceae bacterium]
MTVVFVDSGLDAGLTWHCGDPLREQRWLEDGTAAVDLSNREVVCLTGSDRATLLNLLGTQKVDTLEVSQSSSTYLLDGNGRIVHSLAFVMTQDAIWGWTEPGHGAALVDHLNRMRFRMDVEARLRPDMTVVWSADPMWGAGDDGDGGAADGGAGHGDADSDPRGRELSVSSPKPDSSRPRRSGTPSCLGGYEVFHPRDDVPTGGRWAGVWAYTARRIAAGVPRFGVDTDARAIPNELGVPSEAVALNKGCYPGQETVAKVYNVGSPPRRLVRLHLDGSEERFLDSGAVLTCVSAPDVPIGFLGSMAYHHQLGPIGLGLVKRDTDDDATILADGVPARIEPLVDRDVGLHVRADLNTQISRRRL